jgi:hypothetical protein
MAGLIESVLEVLNLLLVSKQFGIIIIILIIIIFVLLFVLWQQKRFQDQIELKMKAADNAREQGFQTQKEIRESLGMQHEIISKTNEDLRAELERIRNDQDKFEKDVKRALSAGILEIKNSLSETTIQEILEELPENFKEDLENRLMQVTEKALANVDEQLRSQGPDKTIDIIGRYISDPHQLSREIAFYLTHDEELKYELAHYGNWQKWFRQRGL